VIESVAVESRRAAAERPAALCERFGTFPTLTRTFRDDPVRVRRGVVTEPTAWEPVS
jgi:hypothetical protein